jgi:DNA-binding MarR family transcriptional regulator
MHSMTDDLETFRECRECLCFAVRRVARAVTQHYERHLRPTGLRVTQFSVLARLAQTGPMPINRLASQMGLERTTLSRNLRPLVAKRWITLSEEADRRVHNVEITAKGRAVARAALPAWRQAQASAKKKLGALHLDALLAAAG